ncbi:MAG: ATP-binding protein [Oscillospiraceae bacterium]|nr:ATP-binding protein [Oscillospiraceae bacterium]
MSNNLPQTLNKIGQLLFSQPHEQSAKGQEQSLWECMGMVARCMNADCAYLWRADTEKHTLYRTYSWEAGKPLECIDENNTLSLKDNMLDAASRLFYTGKAVYGKAENLSDEYRNFFNMGIKSAAVFPLILDENLWGLFTLECVDIERVFDENEVALLSLTALMLADFVQSRSVSQRLCSEREAAEAEAAKFCAILNAIPMPVSVVDKNLRWIFVNAAVEEMLSIPFESIIGERCSRWGRNICGTPQCSVACLGRGEKVSYFNQNNFTFKVDANVVSDSSSGEKIGYVEVIQDVTHVENMAVEQMNINAANEAKSAFLAAMSHEIRTPMNTVLGLADIHRNHPNTHPGAREVFSQIHVAGEFLLDIVNDILDMSKIESGKVEIRTENYNPLELINNSVQLSHMRYKQKPIKFCLSVGEQIPAALNGDVTKITKILNNILSNAFKYTDAGEVELSAQSQFPSGFAVGQDAILLLKVRDTGQGMSPEQLKTCFEDFTRFNYEQNRGTEGTGLGMGITKKLTELMGGIIEIESKEAQGTLVTVTLPQKIIATELCVPQALTQVIDDVPAHEPPVAFQAHQEQDAQREDSQEIFGNVLIVDDIEMNIQVAKGYMSLYGVEVDTATGAKAALDKIAAGASYSIVFMDYMMPGMNGIEATKELRDMGYDKPIVALTANAIIGQKEMFLRSGFDDYITKPINTDELDAIFDKFVYGEQYTPLSRTPVNDSTNDNVLLTHFDDSQREKQKASVSVSPAGGDRTALHKYFVKDAQNAVLIFRNYLNTPEPSDTEINNFATLAHGIKSALNLIGENELSATAFELEKAGKARELEYIRVCTPSLISALERLITLFTAEKGAENTGKCRDTALSELSEAAREKLITKLDDIYSACNYFDSSAAVAALGELMSAALPLAIQKTLDEIDMALLHSDFEAAGAAARDLWEQMGEVRKSP